MRDHLPYLSSLYNSKFGGSQSGTFALYSIQTYTGRSHIPFVSELQKVSNFSGNHAKELTHISSETPERLAEYLRGQKLHGVDDGKITFRNVLLKDGDVVKLKDGYYKLTIKNVFFAIITILGENSTTEREKIIKHAVYLSGPDLVNIVENSNGAIVYVSGDLTKGRKDAFHKALVATCQDLFGKLDTIDEGVDIRTHLTYTSGRTMKFISTIDSPTNPNQPGKVVKIVIYNLAYEDGEYLVSTFDSEAIKDLEKDSLPTFESAEDVKKYIKEKYPNDSYVDHGNFGLIRKIHDTPDAPQKAERPPGYDMTELAEVVTTLYPTDDGDERD